MKLNKSSLDRISLKLERHVAQRTSSGHVVKKETQPGRLVGQPHCVASELRGESLML